MEPKNRSLAASAPTPAEIKIRPRKMKAINIVWIFLPIIELYTPFLCLTQAFMQN
jgi:hypothetical protein